RVIAAMKFERLDYLGGQLGAAVTQRPWFRDLAADVRARRGARPFDAVVPVPLHAWRRFRRGHDQARGIAEPIAAALGVPCRNLLRRRRATAPQSARDEAERRRNVRDAFVCRGPQRGKTVLLVDDVYTTGSTLIAAARPLVRAGATVEALVVARTPRWDEVPGVE
ncbi:MAG: phosphoribosyltransferase family protein, partial [Acidobacteriota bacterium]